MFRHILVGPWLRRIVRADIVGRENLPKRGGYVLALGSHKTELESAIVSIWLARHKLHFYAKAEYWRRGWLLAWFMTAIGQIPVERGDAKQANGALNTGAQLLARGKVLAVYPEGTRSPDDKLHGGHTGFARTLIRSGAHVPVIPVGLVGMEAISPNGSGFMPRRARVKIVIGEPIHLTSEERRLVAERQSGESRVAAQFTKRVMLEIARLCGKQYVPERLAVWSR